MRMREALLQRNHPSSHSDTFGSNNSKRYVIKKIARPRGIFLRFNDNTKLTKFVFSSNYSSESCFTQQRNNSTTRYDTSSHNTTYYNSGTDNSKTNDSKTNDPTTNDTTSDDPDNTNNSCAATR